MKKIYFKILIVLSLVILTMQSALAEHVSGYYRKNGTYVAPHERSDRNETKNDNYSTKGNYNPYTGEEGHKEPDSF